MTEYFKGTITGEKIVDTFPAGGIVFIQTDADLDIAWWNDAAQAFGVAQTITAPGDEVSAASYKAKLTAASANVQAIAGS